MSATAVPVDLGTRRRIHLVGVGGAGMSAIATVLVALGHEVTGSDLKESAALERLRALGVRVSIGHDAASVAGAGLVAHSSAVKDANVELVAARDASIQVASRAELLASITRLRRTIAVSGTHGKTTTTTMLGLVLVEAGLDPSFLVGGDVNEIGTNAVWGGGPWLAVEADESDGTFLALDPAVAIVTSVEADHLDYYGSFAGLRDAFARFASLAQLGAVLCADDPVAAGLLGADVGGPARMTYGFAEGADYRILDFRGGRSSIAFDVARSGERLGRLELPVPGAHNARNATAALAAAHLAGADFDAARRALERFAGVARRFEFRGESRGVTYVDDYAHLPGEVAATLAAARAGGWSRVVAVFQPHRYSRTAALATAFADAFVDADVVVVTGIYAAGEPPVPGVSARLVLDAVAHAHPSLEAVYLPQRDELVAYLRQHLRPGDCCLSLGAGDLTSLADELLSAPVR